MARKRWAVVIPVGKKLKVLASDPGRVDWVHAKQEAQGVANWMGGVVVDGELLMNPKTRAKCLRDAGLGRFAKRAARPAKKGSGK